MCDPFYLHAMNLTNNHIKIKRAFSEYPKRRPSRSEDGMDINDDIYEYMNNREYSQETQYGTDCTESIDSNYDLRPLPQTNGYPLQLCPSAQSRQCPL